MPIRAEMKDRYPKDWPEIRARILKRANGRCELCGVPNYAVGHRRSDGQFVQLDVGQNYSDACEKAVAEDPAGEFKVIVIVLTIMHVHDMNPEACDDDNLKAACQRCHNRHDTNHRNSTRAVSRIAKEKQRGQMFF